MKSKLTVTIDKDLLPRAKNCAHARKMSLSKMIETYLRETTLETEPSFSEKWKGKFQAAQRKDIRYQQLARKYL